jgi:hypothetical protein
VFWILNNSLGIKKKPAGIAGGRSPGGQLPAKRDREKGGRDSGIGQAKLQTSRTGEDHPKLEERG